MYPGLWAKTQPDKPAIIMAETGKTLTYKELEDRSLRLANHFRAIGLKPGSHIAMMAENRVEIIEAFWAALRSGLYITIVNCHLTPAESSYIIHDCDAELVIISSRLESASAMHAECADLPHRITIGGSFEGASNYEQVIENAYDVRPAYEPRGQSMLYSSGTTGRPKGILLDLPDQPVDNEDVPLVQLFSRLYGFDEESVYLSPAPLYHSAPVNFIMTTHSKGGTAVIMPRFEAERALELIDEYRITHAQWVPTMFIRMLKLPEDVRIKYDVSSMKAAIHAAAPCPADVKRKMIEWWGPVIYEYYSSTESIGITVINSEEALMRPGSVGRDGLTSIVHICGPEGEELPYGEIGTIYFEKDKAPFHYYKDPVKTAESRHPLHPSWSTTGDVGYLDQDRYLYLTDRGKWMVISGGVNIYPQEIENELAVHPDVSDIAVIGEPHADLGEIPVAYVVAEEWPENNDNLADDLRFWLGDKLARFKIPQKFYFVASLPRTPAGKLAKGKIVPEKIQQTTKN